MARVEGTCGLTGMINSRCYAPRNFDSYPLWRNEREIDIEYYFWLIEFQSECRFNSLRIELLRDKKNSVIDDEFSYFLMDDLLREKKNENFYENNRIDRA